VKRVLLLVAVLALAALAVWIVATSQYAIGDPPAPEGAGDPAAPGNAMEMTVESITDGDTLRLREGGSVENVRLIGIDTPEVYPEYECYGDEAEAELLRLAPIGSTLRVAPDEDPSDDYDRALLYLWNADGVFINLALVEGGFAEAIRVGSNDAYYDELLAAESRAAHDGLGMWDC
jgi:micrococcal nuclease